MLFIAYFIIFLVGNDSKGKIAGHVVLVYKYKYDVGKQERERTEVGFKIKN